MHAALSALGEGLDCDAPSNTAANDNSTAGVTNKAPHSCPSLGPAYPAPHCNGAINAKREARRGLGSEREGGPFAHIYPPNVSLQPLLNRAALAADSQALARGGLPAVVKVLAQGNPDLLVELILLQVLVQDVHVGVEPATRAQQGEMGMASMCSL
jgi:hypothetical protein